MCPRQIKRVLLVSRSNRRRILNEEMLISEQVRQRVEELYCESIIPSRECAVVIDRIEFGVVAATKATENRSIPQIARDIRNVQTTAVMIGLQGSGMINGLFMQESASVIAIYLNDGWPISGGDPLIPLLYKSSLKDIRMYKAFVNNDSSAIVCTTVQDQVTYALCIVFCLHV